MSDLEDEKLRAEIAKLHKEKEKLEAEIHDTNWNNHIGRYVSLAVPVVTAALTLLGAYLGAWQFLKNLSSDQDKFQQQLRQDRETKRQEREHDFLKSFAASQSTVYFAVCQAVATIVALPARDPRNLKAQLTFIKLYRGDARIVGDESVTQAMDAFYNCLRQPNAVCRDPQQQPRQLKALSLKLADACRASMARTSETDISQISRFEDLFRPYDKVNTVKGP